MMRDTEGNIYPTVIIGTQEWTVENLRATKFNDGTNIPHIARRKKWENPHAPAYCFYANSIDPNDRKKYGALYNWYVVKTGKLAPEGWHVPTDADWNSLEGYLIANGYNWDNSTSDNKIGKSLASTINWSNSGHRGDIGNNTYENNRTGFSGLPGGYRDENGRFNYQGSLGIWWSATKNGGLYAYSRSLENSYEDLYKNIHQKAHGCSVRLVRNVY